MGNKEHHMHIFNILNRLSVCKISFKDEHFKLQSLMSLNTQSLDQNFLYNPVTPTSLYNSQLFLKSFLDNSTQLGQYSSTRPTFFKHQCRLHFSPLLPIHLSAQQIPFVCLQGKTQYDSKAVWIYNSYNNRNLELLILLFTGEEPMVY